MRHTVLRSIIKLVKAVLTSTPTFYGGFTMEKWGVQKGHKNITLISTLSPKVTEKR